MEAKQRKSAFLFKAQKKFRNAVKNGDVSAMCSLSFSRSEPCHHLWIRSNHNDQLSSTNRDCDFFDVSILPMLAPKKGPVELVIRVWAQTKDTRMSLINNLCPVAGWKQTPYPRKKTTKDTDPQGAWDYVWEVDWEHLPKDGWSKIIAAYKDIENQLSKAKCW